jgi:hypothetical protein
VNDYDDKPEGPEELLQHFGVLGMKWGHRKKADAAEIHRARRSLRTKRKNINREEDAARKLQKGSSERTSAEKKVAQKKAAYQKNPDRVIANRLTRGEKIAATILGAAGTVATGVLLPAAASTAAIAVTSARSRAIEQKNDKRNTRK